MFEKVAFWIENWSPCFFLLELQLKPTVYYSCRDTRWIYRRANWYLKAVSNVDTQNTLPKIP